MNFSAKRALWRYAQDRASVASRWTWLQAQISDLEYKIRQHNELQRQIRAAKGLVMLEAEVGPSTSSAISAATPTVNGYSGLLPGSRSCDAGGSNSGTAGSGASRTRPLVRPLFRKRKLVQLGGLHELSKKAARPASIDCRCDGSMAPCAVCTGRRRTELSQEQLELLSAQERIAMVDQGFHPVLSMPDGTSCLIIFHAEKSWGNVPGIQGTRHGGFLLQSGERIAVCRFI